MQNSRIITRKIGKNPDALRAVGIPVFDYLILPRVLALTAMMPILYLHGCAVGMFGGYLMNEQLTRKVWHDGVYHTGDMAWRDEDGHFWYVGRDDDIIKSSGYRIGPFEVESVLMEHPAVLECAVIGVPDPVRTQVVKATVVPARGYVPSEALALELQEYVKTHTAPYKYPRILEFATELPKTISGKIRRTEIRARHKDQDKGDPS